LVLSLALFFYASSSAVDLLPADSGEFQIVAPLLGVAHPPGYPLYTMCGWLATRLIFWGSPAYRLNLLSAFLGAGTLTLMGATTRHWGRQLGAPARASLLGGLATSLTLGGATTFWAQAGVANIRMPTLFLAAWGFYALARHAGRRKAITPKREERKTAQLGETMPSQARHIEPSRTTHPPTPDDKALTLLGLAVGLGLGHHPSLVFVAFFFLLYLLLIDPRLPLQARRWWRPLFVASLALVLPLLYLPLRGAADAFLAPQGLETLGGFWHHVTAQGFEIGRAHV